jgi:hypothetical protein
VIDLCPCILQYTFPSLPRDPELLLPFPFTVDDYICFSICLYLIPFLKKSLALTVLYIYVASSCKKITKATYKLNPGV